MTNFLRAISTSAPGTSSVPRCVQVYLARDKNRAVVAAMSQNIAGVYYEQPAGAVLFDAWPDPEVLGRAFRNAFDLFTLKDADLRHERKSVWPAYLASNLRAVKQFELSFLRISCFGLNSENATVLASCAHPKIAGVELSVTFNPLLPALEIGNQIHSLFNAVNAD